MSTVAETVAAIGHAQQAGQWERLDELLAELPSPMTEEQLPDLLRSLADDDEYTEVIFGVVHAAESAEDGAYARGLVRALPALAISAPWWAETLLKRVMNSPATFAALLDAAAGSTDDERRALRVTAQAAGRAAPERFAEPVDALAEVVRRRE